MSQVETPFIGKGIALLRFLQDAATLRRRRVPSYGSADKLVWLADVPKDRPECRSAFFAGSSELSDIWLEVRKKRPPARPAVPEVVADWVRVQDLDRPESEPELLPEITLLVQRTAPNLEAPRDRAQSTIEKVPEVRRLKDHPEVEDAWLEYLVNQWDPWAEEMRRWQEVQQIYEDVDFMRRRLEESEERYEVLLAVGLLQCRDHTGTAVKRHLLTAPAEISLDAARGLLTVAPAASFEKFRIELDMLDFQQQPRLDGTGLDDRLEELDIEAWNRGRVGEILRIIANRGSPDAQVDEEGLRPLERADETFRVVYAPAIVLRERRPTAYEELVNKCLSLLESDPALATTQPWERFLSEGESLPTPGGREPENNHGLNDADSRVYFPLPTNDEQRKIAERLQVRPYVLVKGPPGTGKSHTIANLVCHLLATGERVLVTAHAPKALTVLRELLPGDVRNLCVTAFGSTREDHRLLEDSVRGILVRRNEWKGGTWAQREIERLEQELSRLEGERASVDRQLRECREAETHSHTVCSGYQGTAAQIAKQLDRDGESYGWFPKMSHPDSSCPLQPAELVFLADVHGSLIEEQLSELRLDVGDFELPDPERFAGAVATLSAAKQHAAVARQGVLEEEVTGLRSVPDEVLAKSQAFLDELECHSTRGGRALGQLAADVVGDLLAGSEERWSRLAKDLAGLLKSMATANERVGAGQIDPPAQVEYRKVLNDARRRLNHFQKGGRRGWRFLAPREVRETRYVEEQCRVDGQPPRDCRSIEILLAFLELKGYVEQFVQIWPIPAALNDLDPRRAAAEAALLAQELNHLLEFLRNVVPEALSIFPAGIRTALADAAERGKWLRLIGAKIAARKVDQAKEPLETWLRAIQSLSETDAHPCVQRLAEALQGQDVAKWKNAWGNRENLKARKAHFDRYQKLTGLLEQGCPGLRDLIDSNRATPEWRQRLSTLDRAWAWSAARAWLHRIADGNHHRPLVEQRQRLQEKVEKVTEELATLKAWQAFLDRLDDTTEQHLTAWTKAVSRIGKGTGKYAYRHRRTARRYLTACIPKMPAWIMPLHKLWETTAPSPGAFDTVIVDEASQAGIESLALLLLAKRVVVVGDDKQNSPEAVGVLEDDIARLAHDHLCAFRFREEFRPDTSFFDHAERAFGNLISLREHFRCVPEIIRFSNDLCYTDAPLIPLRQPPPDRLSPALRSTFVETGLCEGDGQRILNRAEAEKIVRTIEECLDDEAYEGKTMGVIVLQGHAQAELIEKKLAERLEPKVREESKLRCGVPATFQGDQRDVVFLSLVVAPNHQYRALTGLPDQRRFNVAMSRGRDQTWLFHSVQRHDLSREDLRWRLVNFFNSSTHGVSEGLYEELDRLEREARGSHRKPGEQPDPYESWFEVEVALELLRRRFRIRPQYEVAGYRIDLVIEGLEARLAVECDGDSWHGPERYEKDMERQRQLERAGWTFVRVRESEFYANRLGAIEHVLAACHALGVHAIDYHGTPDQQEPITAEDVGEPPIPGNGEATSKLHAEASELVEEEVASVEYGPFTGYTESCGFPDPREASPANIRSALRRIIEADGPLTRASIFRLYVEGCPSLQRAGKAVRQSLNRALWAMLRAGEIVMEDELGDASPIGQVLRLATAPKVRERPAGRRDLLEIPPSELSLILDRLQTSGIGAEVDDEDPARRLLEHYGFVRLTATRRKYLTRVIELRNLKRKESNGSAEAR
ncbi:MAG: AAA family ATPase [Acidobacteria bacterium]|nr:AAA family ATPase [Acidobacteriota bacterium]